MGRICRELDGLPLAIELAAARAKVLSIDEIAILLADRFRFLRSWRRVADPRHQTLAGTIDWSFELLSDEERDLIARLSVFAGGFDLQAVAAVCLAGDDGRALDLVGRLVEASLVVAEVQQGATRYRLLETIRAYAAERLDGSGATEEVRRAHAEHFLERASQARPDFVRFSPERQRAGLALLDRERDNLQAAMEWTLAAASDMALPLAVALRTYWNIRGYGLPGPLMARAGAGATRTHRARASAPKPPRGRRSSPDSRASSSEPRPWPRKRSSSDAAPRTRWRSRPG